MSSKGKRRDYQIKIKWGEDDMKETGRYGTYGGQYIPGTLMSAVKELE